MEEINLNFVAEVEKHPELYDFTFSAYSRKDVTERAWTEIGKKFNLTANDSKEKWRNLRNAFVKAIKSPASGSGRRKKAYYLNEAMKFTLPFVKVVSATGGNLPEVQASEQNEQVFASIEDSVEGESESLDQPELPSLVSQPPPPPPTTSAALPGPSNVGQNPVVARKRKASTNDNTDRRIADYFSAKLRYFELKYQATKIPQRSEALKMFLLSLLPDLEALSPTLIRKFKRKTLSLVEELAEEGSSASTAPIIFSPDSSLSYFE